MSDVTYRPLTNTSSAETFWGSRGSQPPRSISRIFLPDGARWRASVPPPAPEPMMITSYESTENPLVRDSCDLRSGPTAEHRPEGMKHSTMHYSRAVEEWAWPDD